MNRAQASGLLRHDVSNRGSPTTMAMAKHKVVHVPTAKDRKGSAVTGRVFSRIVKRAGPAWSRAPANCWTAPRWA